MIFRSTLPVVFNCLLAAAWIQNVTAFHPALPWQASSSTRPLNTQKEKQSISLQSKTTGEGFGSKNSNRKTSSPAGDFAFQEMLVLLNAMQREGATSRTMDPAKRSELEGYVRTVLANKDDRSYPMEIIGQALLPKSQWKLMFSTSEAVLESLPPDATVFLNILDEENLDYILQFSKKTMGLDRLTAKCKYTFDSGPVQPGLLTYVYEKITTNFLGLQNVGVGLFGMLKGRVTSVESAYFDGTFWIEKGVSPTGTGDFINVYMRVDD